MTIYRASRQYLPASLVAATFAAFSGWCGMQWSWAFIPAFIFLLSAFALLYLGSRPPIEVTFHGLRLGGRFLAWDRIAKIETTAWNSPLVLKLTLLDGGTARLVYPGDLASTERLIRQIRRFSRPSLRQREMLHASREDAPIRAASARKPAAPIRLLRHEDEDEILRIYQQLKGVRRADGASKSKERRDS